MRPANAFVYSTDMPQDCVKAGKTQCIWNHKVYWTGTMEGITGYQAQKCQGHGKPGRKVCWSLIRPLSNMNQKEFEAARRASVKEVAQRLKKQEISYKGAKILALQHFHYQRLREPEDPEDRNVYHDAIAPNSIKGGK